MNRPRPNEADFAQDKGAAKEFLPLQRALTDLLKEKGALGRLDKLQGNAALPKLELASDTRELYGNNALIKDKDGTVKGMVHQGKVFKIDPDDGTVRDKYGKVIKGMRYDEASKTITFQSRDRNLKMVFDPRNDKTTIDDAKTKSHIEVTKQGITYANDGKMRKFVPSDRSFSVDIDATGKATVKGKDGEAMKVGDPNKDLADKIDTKTVKPFTTPDGQIGFKLKDVPAAGKDTNVFPGSHTVVWDSAAKRPDKIEFGKRTWDITDDGAGNYKLKPNDGAAITVKKGDVTFGPDGKIEAKTAANEKLTIDPRKGSETTTTDDKKATTKYVERPGRRPYTVESEKDADGKWGPTKIKDDRGEWKITYKDDKRVPDSISKVEGPGGTFKKGDVAGFDVKENGEVTVNFKPGEKFKSVTFKPDSNQETYVAKDGHKIDVTYAETGKDAAKAFRPTIVKEGKHTYEAKYGDDGKVASLKVDGKETIAALGPLGVKGIEYDPNTKGFKVTQHDGKVHEYDPLRRSERLVDGKVTTETFEDKGGKKHEVVSEDKGGKKVVTSFTDTKGNRFKVTYKDDNPDEVKTITGKDDKPLPVLADFKKRFCRDADPKITVGDDGTYTLTKPDGKPDRKPDGRTSFTKHPQGNSEFESPRYGEVRNTQGMVTETTLGRTVGPQGGLVIERGAGRGNFRPIQSLTLKDTGETLTRDRTTGDYVYRNPEEPDKPQTFKGASVVTDANGNVSINGRPIGKDPSGEDIVTALKARPAAPDVRPPLPFDPRRPDRLPDAGRDRLPGPVPPPFAPMDAMQQIRIATDARHFQGPQRIPNGVRWGDGTTVTTERTPFGSVTTTTDGVTGRQTVYSKDRFNNLTRIANPDGSVWTKAAPARNGWETWTDNSVPPNQVYAKTSGRGLGLDRYGYFHFTRADRTPNGWQPVNYACSPNFINIYENQFARVQRAARFQPMLPPWRMPPNPRFARDPRLLV
jgi:hypothetical protein